MASSDNVSNDTGVVFKKSNGFYFIHPAGKPGQTVSCELSPGLRSVRSSKRAGPGQWAGEVDSIAIGDEVEFAVSDSGSGLIVAVTPRLSQLSRRSTASHRGAYAGEQVIAANLDQVIPVFAAANPAPHWNLLDRYLAAAGSQDLPARICITKLDLARDANGALDREIDCVASDYRRIGYPVHFVSALTGEGLDELREALRGRFSVLVGKSGVGKTSLLNALRPELGLRVKDVSRATGKGRHATTVPERFELVGGGAILDTPGVREFGLWDVPPDELAELFPEIRTWIGRCRFGLDCRHDEEPGCAVRRAVMAGEISPRRYHSYLRLREEGGRS
jgi:ribosome biogenesis GTPase